jgi:hypothetical protein
VVQVVDYNGSERKEPVVGLARLIDVDFGYLRGVWFYADHGMTMPEKQIDKFKAAARELRTNDDPAAFDRKMKRLQLAKPKRPAKKPTPKQKAR